MDHQNYSANANREGPLPDCSGGPWLTDQLREGGPRFRGESTGVPMVSSRGSGLRSSSARTRGGRRKEWLKAGETTWAKAGHSAQLPSIAPDSTATLAP